MPPSTTFLQIECWALILLNLDSSWLRFCRIAPTAWSQSSPKHSRTCFLLLSQPVGWAANPTLYSLRESWILFWSPVSPCPITLPTSPPWHGETAPPSTGWGGARRGSVPLPPQRASRTRAPHTPHPSRDISGSPQGPGGSSGCPRGCVGCWSSNGSRETFLFPHLFLLLSWEIWLTGSLFSCLLPLFSPRFHLLPCVALFPLPFLFYFLPPPTRSGLISVFSCFCLPPFGSQRAHQLHRHVWDAETHVPTSRPWEEMPGSRCL